MPLTLLQNTWPVLLAGDAPADGPGMGSLLFPVAMIIVLFYFMLIRPEQTKKKAHQGLLNSLKKNDRIVTVGGIYGVVTNVQKDAD